MAPSGAKTWIEIDSRALSKNLSQLRGLLQNGSQLCPIVKANAYGHHLETIVRLLATEGVGLFGVDSIDEAMQVRRLSPTAEIFILGFTTTERLTDVILGKITQTIYDLPTLEKLIELAAQHQSRALINIKLETGLNRQGIASRQLQDLLRTIKANAHWVELRGLSTHFAESENTSNQDFSRQQLANFIYQVENLKTQGIEPPFIHASCSAAFMTLPQSQLTMTRPGIAIYGLWPSDDVRQMMRLKGLELTPILSWKTRIAQVKDLVAGDTVGYDRTFRVDRPMRIAVLPVGYYDGYRRHLGNHGYVLINGRKCNIIGNICMNMCMVDVSQIPQIKVGDIVTLLGRDGMNQITAEDLAQLYGTINYEVVTTINPLIPRIVC